MRPERLVSLTVRPERPIWSVNWSELFLAYARLVEFQMADDDPERGFEPCSVVVAFRLDPGVERWETTDGGVYCTAELTDRFRYWALRVHEEFSPYARARAARVSR